MAQPSLADVHIDAALTDFSVAFFQDADKFVARQFSPVVPVGKQSDKYFIYDKAETLRTDAVKRAPGTEAAVRNYKLSTGNFFCDVYSIASDVSEQIRANSDPALDPEEDAAKLTMGDIMMRMEVDFAAAAFATSIWDTNVVGTTNFVKWNDPSSVPITDISTGIETIGDNTGFDPNQGEDRHGAGLESADGRCGSMRETERERVFMPPPASERILDLGIDSGIDVDERR